MNHISIQNSLIEIIGGMEIKRSQKVLSYLPETGLSQKTLPLIVVDSPDLDQVATWDKSYIREVYSCNLHFIDAFKVSPAGQQDTLSYLKWLRMRTIKEILSAPNMNLPQLHIHNGFLSYSFENEVLEFEGVNLMKIAATLTIPIISRKDQTWVFDDGIASSLGLAQDIHN